MQPLGLVRESKAKHFSMCRTEWKSHLPQAPGHALAIAAQESFSLVCCKLLLTHASFFTREPVSSTTLHSRHCCNLFMGFSCARHWALHLIFVELHEVSPGCTPACEWSPFSSCILTAPLNSSSNLLSQCSVFQVVNQELRVLAQVLIPVSSSHTADPHTSSLMAQTIFQQSYDHVL